MGGMTGRELAAIRQGLLGMIGALFFASASVTFLLVEGRGLRDDLLVRHAARPVDGLRVAEGQCRGRMLLLRTCEATLVWSGQEARGARRISHTFVARGADSRQAQAVADPARPGLATTDLALDRLANRALTLAGLGLFGLMLAGGCGLPALRALHALRRSWRGRAA